MRYYILLSFIFATCASYAQEKPRERPPVILMRFVENYEFLKDSTKATEPFDKLKFIPLNDSKSSYISLGGEVNTFYESIYNRMDEGEGYLLTRIMAHIDVHLGNRFRLFVQPASGFDSFRTAEPRIIDRDELFLLNLFADYKIVDSEKASLTARIGRQEFNYGRGRLVTIREGPNVRQYWEGVKFMYQSKKWNVDAFLTEYGINELGVFDNPILEGEETFWGTYAQSKQPVLKEANLDVYYLGFEDKESQFFNADGTETRHTLGVRIYNAEGNWDYDADIAGQFGSVGESDIAAFGFYGEVGYTLNNKEPVKKRLGLKVDYFTGDRDSTDTKLNSFNPMYPRQGYYRGAGALYAANFWDIHPSFTISKAKEYEFLVDWAWYWRSSIEDGIYIGGSGIPLIPPGESRKDYLGSQLNFQFTYHINKYFQTMINYSHFYAGGFILDNPTPMEVSDFLNVRVIFRF